MLLRSDRRAWKQGPFGRFGNDPELLLSSSQGYCQSRSLFGDVVLATRQLRPVSYYFKKGSESKYMRFGFIGQEVDTA